MKITLRRRADDWTAYINNDTRRWGCGKTEGEAVWDCLRSHARDLNIEIDRPKG